MKLDQKYRYSHPVQSPSRVHQDPELSNIIAWPKATLRRLNIVPKQFEQISYNQRGLRLVDSSTEVGSDVSFTGPHAVQRLTPLDSLEREFERLVKQWQEDTFAVSSLTKIYAHPAHMRIIAMGSRGIPLVLKDLQKNGGRWFYALKFMAGEDVSAGISNFEDAREAWIVWGYKKNYI